MTIFTGSPATMTSARFRPEALRHRLSPVLPLKKEKGNKRHRLRREAFLFGKALYEPRVLVEA